MRTITALLPILALLSSAALPTLAGAQTEAQIPQPSEAAETAVISEEPHTVGWRFINQRRAISLDPTCGWAQGKADILYVADAFEVIEKLNELLAE